MPFRKFRARLSSNISQESTVSRSTDDQSWERRSFDHPPVIPRVRSTRTLGLVGDPRYNRDSAGSVRFGDRTLWIWRDTQEVTSAGQIQQNNLWSSTASWSNHNDDDSPSFSHDGRRHSSFSGRPERTTANALVLKHYGEHNPERAFFRIIHDGCEPKAGIRKDGSRRAMWPNTSPLVVSSSENGRIIAYAWVQKAHIARDGSIATQNPATTLYKLTHVSPGDENALPRANVVDGNFWSENEIPYGTYGSVLKDGIAYLFAQVGNNVIAVARVLCDYIERKSCYEYWVDGDWTKTRPSINDRTIDVGNAGAGGQGTFYWSDAWECFVWIGGSATPGAHCYISTSPASTGPWTQPFMFFKGDDGTHFSLGQSVQAHPSLLRDGEDENGMYLTYTKCDAGPNGTVIYSTPLVYIEWDDDDSSE